MDAFKQSGYDLGNSELKSWVEAFNIPRNSITGGMYPKHNASQDEYGRTPVFSACIRSSEQSRRKFNFAEYPEEAEPRRCDKNELLLAVI